MQQEFDRKLGADFISSVADKPGVYLFGEPSGRIIYVGKAKNLRRRLAQYRLAKRKKSQRKMRAIIKAAGSLEFQVCASEAEALLLENELIQKHRPPFNVAGAYFFLYPYLGLKSQRHPTRILSVAYSTHPEALEESGFELFGAFRSRRTVGAAFDALSFLLPYLGHRDLTASRQFGDLPFTRIISFRQIEEEWLNLLIEFLRGEAPTYLDRLSLHLLEKPGARRQALEVQEHLRNLRNFFLAEAAKLRAALRNQGLSAAHVSQVERDRLFLRLAANKST